MLPDIWGRYAWNFLHLVTLGYPEYPTAEDKENYYNYLHYLQYVLPCAKCRNNLSVHLKNYPLTDEILSTRSSFVKWGIDMHNIVNYSIGKPVLSYEEAMNDINGLAHPHKKSYFNAIYWILFVIVLIILCLLVYRLKKN
jgi:hypothetical protein